METEIVALLLGVASGITKDVAVASLRAFFTQEADFVQRLIRDTCGRFPKPESTDRGRQVGVLRRQEGAPVLLG